MAANSTESTGIESTTQNKSSRPAALALTPVGYWVTWNGGARVLRGVDDLD